LLTTENLGEFVMIREALERSGRPILPPRRPLLPRQPI
jgi:hypothetical protein